ncbi:hypothetical protein AVEN_37259-1 [Araneus ventricosus]|uniref:Histone-lysine N-methyltransferase SETMAR n=1 Tax=Araneus ventricosus TaxID=182803 RepID=A0A4Y2KJY0_ARAVE|nr:hypothetical protein AVEN_37259-1 [Araneus ventricosus]
MLDRGETLPPGGTADNYIHYNLEPEGVVSPKLSRILPKKVLFLLPRVDKKIRTYCNPESDDYQKFNKPGVHCIQTKDRSHISAAQLTPLFDHPPYCPDLAPSDFHLFLKLKELLGGKRFGSNEELENAANTWLNELAAEEYNMGNLKLVNRYDKCLNVGGDYVEK